MSSETFAKSILDFIQAEGYQPRQVEELARVMGIAEPEWGDFHDACKALMKSGRVALGTGQALMLAAPPGKLIGSFRANPRGFGFVVPNTPNAHGDLYIPEAATSGAMTGDVVMARVKKRGKRRGRMIFEGVIEEVIRRGQSRFVGELSRQFKRWYVIPDGNTLHVPIIVDDPGAKNARLGDSVVVEIIQYPGSGRDARGVIVKVLGEHGLPDVDTQGIIEQYQLPHAFPEEVESSARRIASDFDPQSARVGREDFTKQTVITIDPVDARDFDDAISVEKHEDGTWTLGVHIADVASFVHVGAPIDEEARQRTTSVYLPRTVLPMLPEVLSNGLCSLQEREVRLTKTALIDYDSGGRVLRERVFNSVIKSTKRLTYEQAGKILSGKPGRTSAKVVALLSDMERLARTIHERRRGEGMIELDLPEVDLVYDDDGSVVDAKPADQSYPHKIIEMFMVEANEAVARLLKAAGVPYLRRIHDEPAEDSGSGARKMLEVLGYELPADASREEIQQLLKSVAGKPESFTVNLSILRTMQPAEYSPAEVGHYALGSENYSHFTSPIRRYPDLTIHRLIDRLVKGTLADEPMIPTEDELYDLGKACSNGERQAEAAERELTEVLILRLLDRQLGERYQGVVTGVANVGVFVQLERFLIEGLLTFDQLGDDWWEVDADRGSVEGERTGNRVSIGDRLEVQTVRISIPNRRLNLGLAEPLPRTRKKGSGASSKKSSKKRGGRPVKRRSSGRPAAKRNRRRR